VKRVQRTAGGSTLAQPRPGAEIKAPAAPPRPLISDVTLEHGPVDVLGRLFLKADTAARQRGVHLSFAPMQALVETNRRHVATWRPLLPIFDPAAGGITPQNSFCILGHNAQGEVIATQAARLYEWPNTTFHEEAESLRLLYADPERSKLPGESIEVTARDARKVTGRVVFAGGAWYRPDYRGRQLAEIFTRVCRGYAYTRWKHEYHTSVMVEAMLARTGMAAKSGYSKVDWAVTFKGSVCGPTEAIRCAFVWMEPDEMLSGIEDFLANFDAQVDAGVGQSRAKQYG
jgi:hypothetical protein